MISFEDIMECVNTEFQKLKPSDGFVLSDDRKSVNRDNWAQLVELYKENHVIPFLGAGMSSPIYKGWGDSLMNLLQGNKDERNKLNVFLSASQFEEAAEYVQETITKNQFIARVRRMFAKEKIGDRVEKTTSYLVSKVFPQAPVFTTNFDQVVEECYLVTGNSFSNNVHPLSVTDKADAIILDAVKNHKHRLFKIHGDIENSGSLVFTKEQYDEVYFRKGFNKALETISEFGTFLFLGCSCGGNDRYADIFKKVVQKTNEFECLIQHFAFLELPEHEDNTTEEAYSDLMEKRGRELASWGVFPIWYPRKEYDAVKVLLNELIKSSSDPDKRENTCKIEKKDIGTFLNRRLVERRDMHPSFVLMQHIVDEQMIPNAREQRFIETMGQVDDCEDAKTISQCVIDSWKEEKRCHVLIEGEGGMGKTVAMLHLATKELEVTCPVVYCQVHELKSFMEVNTSKDKGSAENNPIDLYLKKVVCQEKQEYFSQLELISKTHWEKTPGLILLLDGFNEVSNDDRGAIIGELEKWLVINSGVQVIATSRDVLRRDMSRLGNLHSFRLQKLSKEVIDSVLTKNKVSGEIGRRKNDLYGVLCRPLMLMLYIRSKLISNNVSSFVKIENRLLNPGKLIGNYLQMEINSFAKTEKEAFPIAVACYFFAPYIAYVMNRRNIFVLCKEEFDKTITECFGLYESARINHRLPSQLTDVLDEMNEPCSEISLRQIRALLSGKLCLFVKRTNYDNTDEYSMVHQDFRDGLSAFHVINQSKMLEFEKNAWNEPLGPKATSFVGDLLGKNEFLHVWEFNRREKPLHKTRFTNLLNVLDVLETRANVYKELDYSGMDLTSFSLFQRKLEGSLRIKLSENPNCFEKTRFSLNTIMAEGPTQYVRLVSISQDGEYCVSCSRGSEVFVMGLRSGELRYVWNCNSFTYVNAITMCPYDNKCVLGLSDDTIRILNIETGEEERVLDKHEGSVLSVAVSSEGKRCVSGSADGTIRIWNMETGEEEHVLKGHTDSVVAVAISPDGRYCVSGSLDGTVRIWNMETEEEHVLDAYKDEIETVAVSPDGKRCVSGSADGTIRIWDMETGEEEYVFEEYAYNRGSAVAITPDGRNCIIGSYDGMVRIWDMETGEEEHVLNGHTDGVFAVAISPDGRYCASGSQDGTVRIWNIETGEEEHVLKGHTDSVFAVAISPDGRYCASGSFDYTVRIWDMKTGVMERELEGAPNCVNFLAVCPDSKRFVCALHDRTVRIWNLETGIQEHVLNGHEGPVLSVAVSPDGKRCVSGSEDGTIRIWNMETGEEEHVFDGHEEKINAVTVSPDGKHCVSGSFDGTIRVWNMKTGEEEHVLEGHAKKINTVAITPDGKRCISSACDDTIRIWNMETGEEENVSQGTKNGSDAVAITPDGKRCISVANKRIEVRNVETGVLEHFWGYNSLHDFALAVSLDGKWCATGAYDNAVRIWNMETGEEEHVLKGHTASVFAVAISPNGRYCISGSHDNTMIVWNVRTAMLEKNITILPRVNLIGVDLQKACFDSVATQMIYRQNGAIVNDLLDEIF